MRDLVTADNCHFEDVVQNNHSRPALGPQRHFSPTRELRDTGPLHPAAIFSPTKDLFSGPLGLPMLTSPLPTGRLSPLLPLDMPSRWPQLRLY